MFATETFKNQIALSPNIELLKKIILFKIIFSYTLKKKKKSILLMEGMHKNNIFSVSDIYFIGACSHFSFTSSLIGL